MREPSPNQAHSGRRRWTAAGRRRARRLAAMTAVAALPIVASAAAIAPAWAGAYSGRVVHSTTVLTNCVPDVGVCGYPDAETSGVPGTTVLQEVPNQVSSGPGWFFDPRGFVKVFGNGADLSDLLIPYNVTIAASNVTLQDDLITHGVITGASLHGTTAAIPPPDPALDVAITLRHTSNVTIEDTTISGLEPGTSTLAAGIKDVYSDSTGLQILSDNIANTSTAIQVSMGTITGSYIHSEIPGASGGKIAGIESDGGSGSMTIQDNTILVGTSTEYAIGLFTTYGAQANKVITCNIMAGGNYVLYGGFNSGGPDSSNIQVTDNRFSRFFYPNGGVHGPAVHWDPLGPGNVWSGNFWDDTLATIPAP